MQPTSTNPILATLAEALNENAGNRITRQLATGLILEVEMAIARQAALPISGTPAANDGAAQDESKA